MSTGPYQVLQEGQEATQGSVIVKNTFLTVVDDQDQERQSGMRRTLSESNISSSAASAASSSTGSKASASSQTLMSTSWLQQMRRLALGDDSEEPSRSRGEAAPSGSQSRSSESGVKFPFLGHDREKQKLGATNSDLKAGRSQSGESSRSSGASASGSSGSRKKPSKVRLMSVDGPCHRVMDHIAPEPDEELIDKIHSETGAALPQLQALERQGALALIPRTPDGTITSVGSMLHAEETCLPCIFWFRKMCSKGVGCSYCHFEHEGQRNKRIRPSKKTREMQKKSQEDIPSSNASCTGDDMTEEDPKLPSTMSL